jgi:hypothetical protein
MHGGLQAKMVGTALGGEYAMLPPPSVVQHSDGSRVVKLGRVIFVCLGFVCGAVRNYRTYFSIVVSTVYLPPIAFLATSGSNASLWLSAK